MKEKALQGLKKRGIDGVLSFRDILAEIVSRVDPDKNYEKSALLQVIRLLKHYDLLKDPQLELFARKKKRVKSET